MENYDLAVLGAGPGGYVAALYAAQLGMKVCLIEEDKVGGTCLNYGCIPTKALIASARAFSRIKASEKLGIKSENVSLDFSVIFGRKNEVVQRLAAGIRSLLKFRKVVLKKERGTLVNRNLIKVGACKIQAKDIIIATGSSPVGIPQASVDGHSILFSKELLEKTEIPKDLVIIGGGVIGCEFASLFNEFGTRVRIIEMMQHLMPGVDKEISKKLELFFKKKGVEVLTGVKAEAIDKNDADRQIVKISSGEKVLCDKVLVSVGRRANVSNVGLEHAEIKFDKNGIRVDKSLRTNIDNIYAIGDCIGGHMLAHVASYEGIIASSNIMGEKNMADYTAVPNCIFTDPEIASVGINEEKARSDKLDVSISRFYFRALGRAHILNDIDGFVKMVSCKKTKKILGVDIMGEGATELIGEATLAIRSGLTVSDLAKTIHAHPTMAEAILEVAHVAEGKPIHAL